MQEFVEYLIYQTLGGAFDCALLWFCVDSFPNRKNRFGIRFGLMMLYLVLTSFIRGFRIPLMLDMLMRISVFVTELAALKEMTWKKVIYHSIICYMVVELCYTVGSYASTYIWPGYIDLALYPGPGEMGLYTLLLLVKIAAVLPLRILVKHQGSRNPGRTQFALLMIPFALFLYLRQLNFLLWYRGEVVQQEMGVLAVIAGIVCYLIVLLSENQVAYLENKRQLDAMTLLLEKEREYHAERNRNAEETRKLAHDMKNHLRTIQKLSHEEEVQNYIGSIIGEVSKREMLYQTGNPAVDIILNDKFHLCQEKQIRLTPYMDAAGMTFIRPVDVSVLFGNLLDNAIEAVEGFAEVERREIRLKIGPRGQFYVIRIENPYDENPVRLEGNSFQSRKKSGLHGYGLANVSQVVESYGGQMNVQAEQGLFTVTILLPVPENDR